MAASVTAAFPTLAERTKNFSAALASLFLTGFETLPIAPKPILSSAALTAPTPIERVFFKSGFNSCPVSSSYFSISALADPPSIPPINKPAVAAPPSRESPITPINGAFSANCLYNLLGSKNSPIVLAALACSPVAGAASAKVVSAFF